MTGGNDGGKNHLPPAPAPAAGLKKGPWTAAEDAVLVEYVRKHGEGNWNALQRNTGLLRCGKSCRLRWANHLRPNLKKGSFSAEEERLILELHSKLGNKWARMATQLPGRTDNEIKNYWNTRIKRRQRAGLPLYPPEIQRQTMLYRHSPEGNSKFGGNVGQIPFFDPVPINFSSPPANSLFVKRATEGNLGFPVSFQVPATTTLTTPLNVVNLQVQQQPLCPFSVKMELPSSQFCPQPSGGEDPWERSNSGLLDALLGGTTADRRQAGNSSDMMISGSASEDQKCVGTIPSDPKMKSEPVDHNIRSRNDDLSAFFDFMCPSQVPIESITTTTNWCKNESGEISNGQLSGVTDDDIGLEMQQLASSLSMVPDDPTWNIPSGQWDNMPGIC